jgi:hypothetical protein
MKDQEKYFKKNLQLLQKTHPLLVHQLGLTDPEDLEICWTQQEEINLKRFYEGQSYYYHSPISALGEAKEWFQSLDLHLATVIFVYGIGLGYYYEAAKAWLKQHPHHSLVFLEEDLGVLYRLCETELGWRLLKDPQVRLVVLRDRHSNKPIFNELSWTYFKDPYIISSIKLYNEVNPEGFLQLTHDLSFHFEQKKAAIDEYMQFGVIFFRNFYPNLLELPHAYWGNGLFNCFSQIPAIICGAGPSLNKNIALLPELKNRALIFAGGSALNALIPKGMIPHFGVAIDPNIYQYSRVAVTQLYHIPFFYRGRLFHEALTAVTGPRLYLSTGTGAYPTPHWFEEQLNIAGEDLDEGHNVVNFSLQIAQALGCNPIIIIGTDLAFTNQEYYADGIAANLNLTQEDLKISSQPGSPLVLREDIHGQPIYTLWKWVTESEWISDFAESHPEITILNATEGGLGFKGVPNLSLQEIAEQYLQKPQEAIAKIDQEIQKYSLSHIRLERILELLQAMMESLDRCAHLFSRLIEENQQLAEQIQQGASFPPTLQSTSMILLESDIEGEVGYSFLLSIFNQVFLRIHHRTIQDLQTPKRRVSKKKIAINKLGLEKQRLLFLRDVARFNRELIQRTIEDSEKNKT